MKKGLVSIVIPTHNRKSVLNRLIKSIFESTYKNIDIIIVDDASSDGTFEFIKKKYKTNKKIKTIRNKKNLFTAESRNVGLKRAEGEFIFFIDDDNVLDRSTISKLVSLLMRDRAVGEVGPVNYSFANKKKVLWCATNRNMFTSLTNQSRDIKEFGKSENWKTDDVPNAFMVRAEIVKKNKIYFKKYFGIMYEESDFAYRIKKLGNSIKVVRDAKIYHDAEQVVDGKVKDYMFHFMNDKRRPYVFARNRILFHSLYSNKYQLLLIMFLCVWFFAGYYIYKIISYSGLGNFSLLKKLSLSISYIRGTIEGIRIVIFEKMIY